MPSSPSTRDRLELQAAGENLNTWGAPKLNAALQRLEEAKDGRFAKALTGNYTLVATNYAADEARMAFLDFTGVGATVTVPAVEKTYLVRNATSGDLIITTGSGVALTLHTGTTAVVAIDGTNVRSIGADADDLATTLAQAKAYTDAASIAAGSLPTATGLSDYTLATGPTGGGTSAVAAWVSVASMFTKLGLGTAATQAIGTSGGTVPLLNGTNTWSGAQTFSGGLTGTLTGSVVGNVTGNVSGSSGSCTGNSASASTAGVCTGNAATATTAAACSGNAATATTATTVSDAAITPAKLSSGHPTWDTSSNFFVGGGIALGSTVGVSTGQSDIFFDFGGNTYFHYDRATAKLTYFQGARALFSVDVNGNAIFKGTVTQSGTP